MILILGLVRSLQCRSHHEREGSGVRDVIKRGELLQEGGRLTYTIELKIEKERMEEIQTKSFFFCDTRASERGRRAGKGEVAQHNSLLRGIVELDKEASFGSGGIGELSRS